ncbi:MAG: efflux RND transporter periplasmic adaptor subunit, partial [Ignavibacteriaceae bacterium]|nr:efflux RND transporter periplasmic adaptor subunit [Ignavibacteriaceae bacterium]
TSKQTSSNDKIFSFINPLTQRITNSSFYKNKKVFYSVIVLLLLIIILMITSFSEDTQSIPTFKVKRDNFLVSIIESGEISAKNATSISTPRVRGNLKVVYLVPEGTYVYANDTVVRFDPTEALNNLRDAESKLELSLSEKSKVLANLKSTITRTESDLKSAELTYELSKLNLEQMKFEAAIKQQESKLQHQRNELSYLKAKQELESQKIIQQSEFSKVEIEVQQKRTDLDRAKRDLEMLTLVAPKEGLAVYETNWSTGRKIAIGDTPWPGMTLISLPDLSSMQSVTFVNEVDVSRVRKDQKVVVKLDAFQDSSFQGKISSVASLGKSKDNNSSIKVFEILVDILSQSEILKPGMTTSNKIVVNEISSVLFIPQEAVFEKEGKKIVYIKSGSSFDESNVELGEKSDNYIIVIKGIKEGNEVALRDPTISIENIESETGNGNNVVIPNGDKK